MIRILGGEWRGRKIATPHGGVTRPTASRVRESIFNILGAEIEKREFYDLFAGSGAVGLEALSRGAARAVFVESSRSGIGCLRENIGLLNCHASARIVESKLPGYLHAPGFAPAPDAILFMDPPYEKEMAQKTMESLATCNATWKEAICVVQTEKKVTLAQSYGPWILGRHYNYGDSLLWVYETTPSNP